MLAVAEVCGNDESTTTADLHPHDAAIPSLNDVAGAELKSKGSPRFHEASNSSPLATPTPT